ncbi:MAG: GDSL-type esterase/lipase family protein [Thermogutta sp.]
MKYFATSRKVRANPGGFFQTAGWLSIWVTTVVTVSALAKSIDASAPFIRFYVAENGNDQWTGRLPDSDAQGSNGPWRSLAPLATAAQNCLSQGPAANIEVVVRPGRYELSSPIVLRFPDAKGCRLVIRGERPLAAMLSGGRRIQNWVPATAIDDLPSQLPLESRPHVFVADLKSMGITEYGSPGGGGLELFYQELPMTLARWPNEGFVKIANLLNEEPFKTHGIPGDKVGKFIYEGSRQDRWQLEKDPWVHGYWFWDWSDQRHPIQSIDSERHIIAIKPPYHHYGYRKGQWYYGFNLLCELDAPGEWYLDRQTGRLYFWPPDSAKTVSELVTGDPTVSSLDSLVEVSGGKNVEITGLVFAHTRRTAISFTDCEDCRVTNSQLYLLGGWGIVIRGGQRCLVKGCQLRLLGEGGVSAEGGDRAKLQSAGHVIEENEISDYGRIYRMYRAGVSIGGVGQSVVHNHIHHAPHQAVGFSGNNHLIAFNEIDHVCLESNDAGAIYAGRDWTMRGTQIVSNYFHHISGFEDRGCMGVYLDDMFCGTTIRKNMFYRVTRAAFIGGGRDNLVENNVFVECRPAVHVDARAMGWASYHVDTTMTERLKAMPFDSPLWQSAYPELVRILQDEPAAPKGNVIRLNICVGGTWEDVEGKARPYLRMEKNLVLPGESVNNLFVDPHGENWHLKPENKIRQELPEFEAIDFDAIGLPKDEAKKSADRFAPLILVSQQVTAEKKQPASPTRWETAIAKFEEKDRAEPPPKDAILFVGSSSIVRWDVPKWFPDLVTLNRGFGGSQIHEVTYYADRIVIPYQPRVIVFYAGDNDIAAGASPEEVLDRFQQFVTKVRTSCPATPIIFISVKPSLARWHLIDSIRRANRMIEEYCRQRPSLRLIFVDVDQPMLGEDGKPRAELFVKDGLHLSEEGYRLWTKLLRPVLDAQIKVSR